MPTLEDEKLLYRYASHRAAITCFNPAGRGAENLRSGTLERSAAVCAGLRVSAVKNPFFLLPPTDADNRRQGPIRSATRRPDEPAALRARTEQRGVPGNTPMHIDFFIAQRSLASAPQVAGLKISAAERASVRLPSASVCVGLR
jgi:hypothetical protein